MCKSKKRILKDVIEPRKSSTTGENNSCRSSEKMEISTSTMEFTYSTSYNYKDSWKSSVSSVTSLSGIRESLPENPHVYDFSEISVATNNFKSNRVSSSSSSSSWRCEIRGSDAIVIQRKFRRPIDVNELTDRLSLICKSHHSSLIKLRGASVSGNYIFLVYDYIHGANLADCLRNPRNPSFTVLSNWMSRIQIAADLAHGLDYIHHSAGLGKSFIHNHIKSNSIIVTESPFNAKICHFGASELCGEVVKSENDSKKPMHFSRSDSGQMKFGGTRGYMSPEFQDTAIPTQKSDVYALGVVILEILSGEEPLKFKIDVNGGGYERVSVIQTARSAVAKGGGGVRQWVDRRLKDSFPVDAAEKLTRVGLECVEEDPSKRPDMGWVTGRVRRLYLDSQQWAEKMGVSPTDYTTTFTPR